MATLSFSINGSPIGSSELKPGTNLVGRAAGCDVRIAHASVSSSHAEIYFNEGALSIRDLGSTNGTFIDDEQIVDAAWLPGQALRFGLVDVGLAELSQVAESEPVAAAVAPARLGLRVAKVEHTTEGGAPAFAAQPQVFNPVRAFPIPASANIRQQGFYRMMRQSFGYPFKRDGLIALICGTLVFCVLDFMGGYSWIIAVIGFGYLAAFMQKMVVSSAQGDEDMPGFPEFSEWYSDIIHPAILLVGTFAASFGPAIAFWLFADMDPTLKVIIGLALLLFGCVSLPMSLLATAMYESMFALNPMLIVPSMVRIAKEYVIVCVLLAVMVALRVGIELGLEFIPIPVVPALLAGFIGLYLLIVQMRILGLLYFFKEEELGWTF